MTLRLNKTRSFLICIWLLMALSFLAGCNQELPLVSEAKIPIDEKLLGQWDLFKQDQYDGHPSAKAKVVKKSDTMYEIQMFNATGKPDSVYDAYLIDFEGERFLQLKQQQDPKKKSEQKPYDIMRYRPEANGYIFERCTYIAYAKDGQEHFQKRISDGLKGKRDIFKFSYFVRPPLAEAEVEAIHAKKDAESREGMLSAKWITTEKVNGRFLALDLTKGNTFNKYNLYTDGTEPNYETGTWSIAGNWASYKGGHLIVHNDSPVVLKLVFTAHSVPFGNTGKTVLQEYRTPFEEYYRINSIESMHLVLQKYNPVTKKTSGSGIRWKITY